MPIMAENTFTEMFYHWGIFLRKYDLRKNVFKPTKRQKGDLVSSEELNYPEKISRDLKVETVDPFAKALLKTLSNPSCWEGPSWLLG